MEARQVSISSGWQWIAGGFRLFMLAPAAWMVACVALLVIGIGLGLIPYLGPLVFNLLTPLFLAGLMEGCRALQAGRKLQVGYLFVGFQRQTVPLVTVGGIYLVGQVIIFGFILMLGGAELREFLQSQAQTSGAPPMQAPQEAAFALLVGIALSLPLTMAVWFAPLLVMFEDMPPIQALQRSLFACLLNVLPFSVYGLVVIGLGALSLLTFGLAFIAVVPTIFGSIYLSYRDIFGAPGATPPQSA